MDKPWKTHLLNKVVKSNPGAYRCYMGSKDLAINLSTARSRAWKDPWSPPLQTVQRDFKQIMVETTTHLSKWCFYCFAVGIRNHVVNDANAKASYVSPLARPGLDLLPGLFHLLRNLLSLPARQWLDLEICAFDGILDDFSSDFSETFPFQTMKSLLLLTSGISVCVYVSLYIHIESSWCITCRCCRNPRPASLAFWVRPGHQLHPPLADSGITPWWQGMLSRIPPSVKLAQTTANLQSKLNFSEKAHQWRNHISTSKGELPKSPAAKTAPLHRARNQQGPLLHQGHGCSKCPSCHMSHSVGWISLSMIPDPNLQPRRHPHLSFSLAKIPNFWLKKIGSPCEKTWREGKWSVQAILMSFLWKKCRMIWMQWKAPFLSPLSCASKQPSWQNCSMTETST